VSLCQTSFGFDSLSYREQTSLLLNTSSGGGEVERIRLKWEGLVLGTVIN